MPRKLHDRERGLRPTLVRITGRYSRDPIIGVRMSRERHGCAKVCVVRPRGTAPATIESVVCADLHILTLDNLLRIPSVELTNLLDKCVEARAIAKGERRDILRAVKAKREHLPVRIDRFTKTAGRTNLRTRARNVGVLPEHIIETAKEVVVMDEVDVATPEDCVATRKAAMPLYTVPAGYEHG